MNIVLVGIYYPVAILRYFQAALLRRNDVELFCIGPYTGRQIPWGGGMLVDCPLPVPNHTLPTLLGMRVQATTVEAELPWEPDLWLQIDAGFHLEGRPRVGKNFIVGTDPHCLDYDYDRKVADKFFCMQTPYMKDEDVWLSYAYDPVWHSPLIPPVTKEYDFGIIGADNRQGPLYQPRNDLVNALRGKGYKVLSAFGKVYEEYQRLLQSCRVGLNWSTRLDTTARVFETMAMGVTLLTNYTPDLSRVGFIAGSDYEGFSSVEQAVARAELLMSNDTRMSGPRWENQSYIGRHTVAPHTWDARISQILSYV